MTMPGLFLEKKLVYLLLPISSKGERQSRSLLFCFLQRQEATGSCMTDWRRQMPILPQIGKWLFRKVRRMAERYRQAYRPQALEIQRCQDENGNAPGNLRSAFVEGLLHDFGQFRMQ